MGLSSTKRRESCICPDGRSGGAIGGGAGSLLGISPMRSFLVVSVVTWATGAAGR